MSETTLEQLRRVAYTGFETLLKTLYCDMVRGAPPPRKTPRSPITRDLIFGAWEGSARYRFLTAKRFATLPNAPVNKITSDIGFIAAYNSRRGKPKRLPIVAQRGWRVAEHHRRREILMRAGKRRGQK